MNIAALEAGAWTKVPKIIMAAPINIPQRLPHRSVNGPQKKDPTILPTVYIENTNPVFGPIVFMLKYF